MPLWHCISEFLKIKKESDELCETYYEEFHGITDFSLVNNSFIAIGGQGMVFKCECFQEGIEPALTAQKGTNCSFDLFCPPKSSPDSV